MKKQKITQQVCLDADDYNFLMQVGIGHKNISQTIKEVLNNYRLLLRAYEKKQKEVEQNVEMIKETTDLAQKYRGQIIKPNQYDRKAEYK